MQFPLSLSDISLWLAITAIIVLAASELLSPHYEKTNIVIDRKRLRTAALILGLLFLFTVLIRTYGIITLP